MKASEMIKILKKGIATYGDCEIEVRSGCDFKSTTTVRARTDNKRKRTTIYIDTEEDDCDTGC